MLIVLDNVFNTEEVAYLRTQLDNSQWQDGKQTAGSLSAAVKTNLQLAEDNPIAIELGNTIVRKLGNNAHFIAAALPEKIYPPKFNCYQDGGEYGHHVDSAIMIPPNASSSMRSDLSATLFLSEPDTYDGGELHIETTFGAQKVKLAAGDLVLYPSNSLHCVTPVTQGRRVSAFFWIQSLVADEAERTLLYDLDQSIQALTQEKSPDDPQLLRLTGVYHNLLRRWAKP